MSLNLQVGSLTYALEYVFDQSVQPQIPKPQVKIFHEFPNQVFFAWKDQQQFTENYKTCYDSLKLLKCLIYSFCIMVV